MDENRRRTLRQPVVEPGCDGREPCGCGIDDEGLPPLGGLGVTFCDRGHPGYPDDLPVCPSCSDEDLARPDVLTALRSLGRR